MSTEPGTAQSDSETFGNVQEISVFVCEIDATCFAMVQWLRRDYLGVGMFVNGVNVDAMLSDDGRSSVGSSSY